MKENLLLLKVLLQIYDFNIKKYAIDKMVNMVDEYNNRYHRTIE